jgi:predicted AlkP superfamily pyrophosphatase or phosphodiesterase
VIRSVSTWRAAAAALILLAIGAAARAPAAEPRHVILISLDGLRPDFYLDERRAIPRLRALAAAGTAARAAEAVFPSVTYPGHASIATGVRPARHGIVFNVIFDPRGGRSRWYEEAADLRAPPIWEWARAAGRTTAAVSWPVTLGARIDWLVAERDYYARQDPLPLLVAASTPGLFERLGVTPAPEIFKDVVRWDEFLTATTAAIIRTGKPDLLLLHLVQLDYFQHRSGREGPDVAPARARIDGHLGTLQAALREAGLADRAAVVVVGDHGFQDVSRTVHPNEVLARAGLGGCAWSEPAWRATAHVTGGSAGVFVNPPGDDDARARAAAALRAEARDRYTVLTRAELDVLGAMPGAALGLEGAPGYMVSGSCGRGLTASARGATHGYLPSRATMATGFVASGAGVRSGVMLDRVRLIDVAPTIARLLGVPAPTVEGRVLHEVLQ